MPDPFGLMIGLLSITAIILVFYYADALSDGNIGSET